MKLPHLFAAVLLALSVSPVPAQDASVAAKPLAGKWRIALGQNPGSTKTDYTGTVTVSAKQNGVLGLVWTVDGSTAYKGLGISNGSAIAAGYSNDAEFGVAVYQAKGDEFVGAWTGSMTKGEMGIEILKSTGAGTGIFQITKGTQPGGADYKGQVTMVQKGDVFEMKWTVGKDTYRGVGIRAGDVLIAGWTTGKDIGVILYSLLDGGRALDGSWAGLGDKKLGKERLER